MTFSQTVAIAAVSTRVFGPRAAPRAGAVAALKVTGPDAALTFSFHTHVPQTSAGLTRWLDLLIADDPLLIGYRLDHISRLLTAAGYDRQLQSRWPTRAARRRAGAPGAVVGRGGPMRGRCGR